MRPRDVPQAWPATIHLQNAERCTYCTVALMRTLLIALTRWPLPATPRWVCLSEKHEMIGRTSSYAFVSPPISAASVPFVAPEVKGS